MKKNIHPRHLVIVLLLLFNSINTNAQVCGVGTTRDTLNWDALDFLPNINSYVTPTAYITLAQSQTQYFTFGTQSVKITHNYSGANDPGEDATNTGETGSYGSGADVHFIGNGAVVFTFAAAVQNVKFSVYDIDRAQKVTVTALNGATAVPITMAKLSGAVLTIAGSGTNTATATAAASTNVANNSTDGTINVDIAGPITSVSLSITLTTTNGSEDGSFWISDLSACSAGTFPTTYYNPSKPFTGQPAYVLAVKDNIVYYVDIATGKAKFLFTDVGHTNINSLAYDPNRHMVYYTYSLTATPATDVALRRYDYDMDTLGVVTADVKTLGIPIYTSGVESGAAAFYNGSLYLGIEAGVVADREATLWKVNLNGSYVPQPQAQQVYSQQSDLHDWGDVGIRNGVIYDFDGKSGNEDYYNFDMLTGNLVHYAPSPATLIPKQSGVDWTGQVYDVGASPNPGTATITPYNYNGTINTAQQHPITVNGVAASGSWGDAGEAFKPKTDFGDAPASYDPAGSDPAVTEKDDSLRLGNTVGIEWAKHTSVDASGDGAEEDGLTGLQAVSTGVSNYLISVKVYNHTGANATLVGWVDANGNGVFDPSEGTTATVSSMATVQSIPLLWSGINVTLIAGSTTFMRLRLTSTANGMTTSNPTGYFPNGEVEDYKVAVVIVLPDQKVSLKAQKTGVKNVTLTWDVNDENGINKYELQRSSDGNNWLTINDRTTAGNTAVATYSFVDMDPTPVSYFRVKVSKNSGATFYSDIKQIDFTKGNSINVNPNPANSISKLNIQSANGGTANISVLDFTGRIMSNETVKIVKGTNSLNLQVVEKLSNGVYKVRVQLDDEILVATLVIVK